MALGLLIRLKLRNHWFCTILHGPWFAHQIKITKPLGLHYIAQPLVCSSDTNCETIGFALYCMALGLLIRFKLRNHWFCTILHGPWFAHQIKITKPLGLHYIAQPLVCSSDTNCETIGFALYCMALGLLIRFKLRNHWFCTILHGPWFVHQIEIVKPLVLHYIAWPLVCTSD